METWEFDPIMCQTVKPRKQNLAQIWPLGPLHALRSSLAESRPQDLSPPLALPSRSWLLQAQRPDSFKYCILLRTDCSMQADLEFVNMGYLGKWWYRINHHLWTYHMALLSVLETGLCVLLCYPGLHRN